MRHFVKVIYLGRSGLRLEVPPLIRWRAVLSLMTPSAAFLVLNQNGKVPK